MNNHTNVVQLFRVCTKLDHSTRFLRAMVIGLLLSERHSDYDANWVSALSRNTEMTEIESHSNSFRELCAK